MKRPELRKHLGAFRFKARRGSCRGVWLSLLNNSAIVKIERDGNSARTISYGSRYWALRTPPAPACRRTEAGINQSSAMEAARLTMMSTVVTGFFRDMDRRIEEMKPKC
ncbi:MAG: hypothetical protein WBD27_07110 [Pyrinomonadaceae bacterium]